MKALLILSAALLVTSCDLVNLEAPKTTPPTGGETTTPPEDTPITVVPMKGGAQAGSTWTVTGKASGLQKGKVTAVAGQESPRVVASGIVNAKGQFSVALDASQVMSSVDFSLFQALWRPAEENCEGSLDLSKKPFLSAPITLRTDQGDLVFGSENDHAHLVWVDSDITYKGSLTCKELLTVSGEVFEVVEAFTADLALLKGWNLVMVHETGNPYDSQTVVDSVLDGNESWTMVL